MTATTVAAEERLLARQIAMSLAIGAAATVVVAWPIVLSPTERIFGDGIAGRHHDPFTVIRQMAASGPPWPYVQPLTDWFGWLLARALHPVAAYNLLVLSTFPLATASAYALARYLGVPHVTAVLSGLLFAFSPVHLAQAAYHPHIAQVQWFPLLLLALFAAVDRPTWWRCGALVAALAAVALSNFYGALIAIVLMPPALLLYWLVSPRAGRRRAGLVRPAVAFSASIAAGVAGLWWLMPAGAEPLAGLAFPASDVARFSARWWAYLTPAVDHPIAGEAAARAFALQGVSTDLVEQQLFLGYTQLSLTLLAAALSLVRWRSDPALRPLFAIAGLGFLATLMSLGPGTAGCEARSWVPACALHDVLPMFRSYARFGIISALTVTVAAGAVLAFLAGRSRAGGWVAAALAFVAVVEYAPLPWRSRDVLPTRAHRWLVAQDPLQRTLECAAPDMHDGNVPWLMQREVHRLGGPFASCRDMELDVKLAALGFTHVVVPAPLAPWPLDALAGLQLAGKFRDSRVYRVTARVPTVLTVASEGFHAPEHQDQDWWTWMGPRGGWTVRNTTATPIEATLTVALASLPQGRDLAVMLDDGAAETVRVDARPERVVLGPWTLTPGDHTLRFLPGGAPYQPSAVGTSGDDRLLTVAFRRPEWRPATDAAVR